MSITLAQADQIINATLVEAQAQQTKPLAVIVLDAGGHPVAYRRQDKASLFRHDIAKAKAMGALGMGADTRIIAQRAKANPVFFSSVAVTTGGDLALSPGGVLIKTNEGDIIGAIGISGDTADKDEACAIAGIASAGLHGGENS
ncbi:heme-binding protein [bacterium AH-315-K03]|nr:heme-binding protein [bacterium AH-315-K03]